MMRWKLGRFGPGVGELGSVRLPGVLVVALLALGFVAVALPLGYQAWYNGRILPGVTVAGVNLGGVTMAVARQELSREAASYTFKVDAAGSHYTLTAVQVGVAFDVTATLDRAYADGRGSLLPTAQPAVVPMVYQLNGQQLGAFASSLEDRIGTTPVDASVTVQNGQLATVPGKSGWTIDRVVLEELLEANARSLSAAVLDLQPHEQLADIQVQMLGPTLSAAEKLMALPIVLSYSGHTYSPSQAQIGGWLDFVKQPDGLGYTLKPEVDTAKVSNYVKKLANQLNVAPVTQQTLVVNGASKTTQTGQNGAAIDQAPLTGAIAAALNQGQPLNYSITSHPVSYVAASTNLNALNLPQYIEVNLSKQHLWVWQNGQIIFDSPITSGATGAGFPTVTGMFHVYEKRTNTHLVGYQYGPLYNYDVFVQYWMAFYQGFGLHDASWRHGDFGGQDYYYGGSHGCVNLPLATAQFLYGWTTIGTPVWVHG